MTSSTSSYSSLDLLLSTWFVMYLHGDRPGGLPNDFLTHGSSTLFIFDSILCDQDALAAEEEFAGKWLSSNLFLDLKREGILKPTKLRNHMPDEFLDYLDDVKSTQTALRTMEIELDAIKKGERSPEQLQLPSNLTELNHYMFMGLAMGLENPSSLLYEWQENHFKVLPLPSGVRQARKQAPLEILSAKEKLHHSREFISVVNALLPKFDLLPKLDPKSPSYAALQQAIDKEKPALYRWIYGDPSMPRELYQELRSGREFRNLDRKIDSSARKRAAKENFNFLMRTREKTKDIRSGVQKIISDIVEGVRTVEDVQSELSLHQRELMSYLPSQHTVKMDVALASAGLAVAVAGSLAGYLPPELALSLGGVDIALATRDAWEAMKAKRQYHGLRQEYPLAFFTRDFYETLKTQNKRMKLHKDPREK